LITGKTVTELSIWQKKHPTDPAFLLLALEKKGLCGYVAHAILIEQGTKQ
jgi:hypothetical protein